MRFDVPIIADAAVVAQPFDTLVVDTFIDTEQRLVFVKVLLHGRLVAETTKGLD